MPSNTISGGGIIWIPSFKDELQIKIQVTHSDGTITDLTNYFMSATITKPNLRDGTPSASLILDNGDGRFKNTFSGGEILEIWCEYSADDPWTPSSANKAYYGKIDNILFSLDMSGCTAELTSRQVPEMHDSPTVIEQYAGIQISDAIKDIASKYLSGVVTTNNVSSTEDIADEDETSSGITINFRNVTPFKAISILLEKAGHDGFIDNDMDLHTFEEGTQKTSKDMIAAGNNLISVSRYGTDNTKLINKAVVYGQEDNNLLLLKTEQDNTSINNLWEKAKIVQDQSLTTNQAVQDRADLELDVGLQLPEGGSFTIMGSPLLNPSEFIRASVNWIGVEGYYKPTLITHSITAEAFTTDIDIKRKKDTLAELFRERINVEEQLRIYKNLNAMENSYRILFSDTPPVWTLSNCEIVDGILQLSDGQTSGEMLTDNFEADENITECELRILSNYPNTDIDTYQVSNDGGFSYQSISPGEVITFNSTGKLLKFKILLNKDADHNPAYEGICLLFK